MIVVLVVADVVLIWHEKVLIQGSPGSIACTQELSKVSMSKVLLVLSRKYL